MSGSGLGDGDSENQNRCPGRASGNSQSQQVFFGKQEARGSEEAVR